MDQLDAIKILLPLGLFLAMLGMGLTLTPHDFKRVLEHPRAVALGVLCQLVLFPLAGLAVIATFDTPPLLAVGLMCVTLCPGGITSNLFSFLAKGDVALSITLTAVISLITPISLPIALQAYLVAKLGEQQAITLPVAETIGLLVVLTIIPVGLGMGLKRRLPGLARSATRGLKHVSVVLVVGLTGLAIQQSWHRIDEIVASIGPAVWVLNVGCMLLGVLLARLGGLPRRQAATIGIEVGIQNDTVALLITGAILHNVSMFLAPAAYAIVSMANGCLFVWLAQAWLAPSGASSRHGRAWPRPAGDVPASGRAVAP